jgi:hypothetical protein
MCPRQTNPAFATLKMTLRFFDFAELKEGKVGGLVIQWGGRGHCAMPHLVKTFDVSQ